MLCCRRGERVQNALRGSPNCQDQESCKDWEWCGSHKPHAPKAHAAHTHTHRAHSTASTPALEKAKLKARLKQRERRCCCSMWQPHCVSVSVPVLASWSTSVVVARTLLFSQFGNEPQLSQISSRFWLATPTRLRLHTHTLTHTCPAVLPQEPKLS